MRPLARSIILPLAAATAAAVATPAAAHPHVFAEARLDVIVDGAGTVTALRHLWRFDDLFSSTVLIEFDQNGDLRLDESELEEVASVVHESLADFDYFQIVSANGKPVTMTAPEKLIATYEDEQLIIMFESRPKEAISLSGKLDFGVYDPTFYTAIDFVEDENMAVSGLPDSCSRQVIRPDPDEAIAMNQQSLTEAFFNEPGGVDMGSLFATRLELTCTAQG